MTMLLSALNALVLIPLAYYLWHRRLGLDLITNGKKKRSNLDQL
jgi:hypothetical protein